MSASRQPARLLAAALLAAISLTATMASADAGGPEQAGVRTALSDAGLLNDPLALAGAVTTLGDVRITHHLRTSEPQIDVTWDAQDAAGRPVLATVRVARRITGKLDIERADAEGLARFARKDVDDDAVRQVTLRREGDRWRVSAMSAEVLASRGGRTQLPLVDLNTHAVSSGHLSVLSDLDELAVLPQTCAVTQAGDVVRVFVSGVAKDAVVTVFANGRSYAAKSDGEAHFEAAVSLPGDARLQSIGVTVYSRASVFDPSAPADSRTWILPILVGAPPALGEQYFGS
ncbi:MAG: hypothetical protein HZA61_07135 [Candidatus Eisenbacteria bacterium]|uniref:Uncharacterized protein n=1 Tax=Eiseniibacteriota bacterium TaxID=2212470 RepID=A0A933SCM3_UNCEI|nr:hypothetical protein [Candidatus Eisenbacteria bacterium]